jgi:cobalt-zinc-cadmium efflux system protein
MGHAHQHDEVDHGQAFAIGVALNLAFVVAGAVVGVLAGSLALVADAAHNFTDVVGLLLAWGASVLARRRPTQRRTYGLRRSSIVAALLNAMLLLVASGGISWEAIRRLIFPEPPPGAAVIWVAASGVVINTATALLFLRGRERDLNIRAAFLHLAGDAGVSLGVVIAAVAIQFTGWSWMDPAVSLGIVVVIVAGTWGLLRESLDMAMDAVPKGIEPQAVEEYLAGLPGVAGVHDLHIWGLSTTEAALTVHLVVPEVTDEDALLARVSREVHGLFGVEHATVQIEKGVAGVCPCGAVCRVQAPVPSQEV